MGVRGEEVGRTVSARQTLSERDLTSLEISETRGRIEGEGEGGAGGGHCECREGIMFGGQRALP